MGGGKKEGQRDARVNIGAAMVWSGPPLARAYPQFLSNDRNAIMKGKRSEKEGIDVPRGIYASLGPIETCRGIHPSNEK